MAYRLSKEAQRDIVRIYVEGVRMFGPLQADAYHDRMFEAFDAIAALPGIARERREITPPVRAHPVKSHLIVYVVDGPDVRIVRIRHRAEDWTRGE